MSASAQNVPTLVVAGQSYSGWVEMRASRQIDAMASEFSATVTEAWATQNKPWQIAPFSPFQLMLGSDVVMTGYIDDYRPSFGGDEHRVTVAGRSKTEDLVDCMPDVSSGQFVGYTLDKIARSLCAPFGISVVVQTQPATALANVMIQRTDKAYEYLERLARLSGILLTDDVNGNLVLTSMGAVRATDALVQGANVWRAESSYSARKRYSRYVVKGQSALQDGSVQTGQQGVATDPGVPRFRQYVAIAESMLQPAGMQARAAWLASYSAARALESTVTVRGWRQSDGTLWAINMLVATQIPYLGISQDMLIAGVEFRIGSEGLLTQLRIGPPDGYTPDPAEVKLKTHKGKASANFALSGWSGVQ